MHTNLRTEFLAEDEENFPPTTHAATSQLIELTIELLESAQEFVA